MKIKLIIWDLDDTLWQGTLAEGDEIRLHERRAAYVREFNRCGLVSAICSKNDPVVARRVLQSLQLWDEFVFPRIAFVPKGEAVRQIIDDMQLRPINVLFIDDNIHNLHEVKATVPDINVVDANSVECDAMLQTIFEENRGSTKSRLEEYRILQRKVDDRQCLSLSNVEFLAGCDIQATFPYLMDNLDFAGRIEELINRSNQLNYTKSRVEAGTIAPMIMDVVRYDSWSVFLWDRYGYYGLIGFMMVERATASLLHLVFSCRAMHMGVEDATLKKAREKFPRLKTHRLVTALPDLGSTWIKEKSFALESTRAMILEREAPGVGRDVKIRVMFDCQSGGIAHFSRFREVIDFDNNPRLFALRMALNGECERQEYPEALVYGAGVDYSDPRWPKPMQPLKDSVFSKAVQKFCQFVQHRGARLMVVLPPENMPANKYRPHLNNTQCRTVAFNSIWRYFADVYSFIDLVDMTDFAAPDDMPDISHYYAGLLQRIAQKIDTWYETKVLSSGVTS
jgi:FkbH-like protein